MPSKKIQAFEAILDALAEKYEVSTTRVANILLGNDIHSVDDMPDWKDLDTVVQEGLVEAEMIRRGSRKGPQETHIEETRKDRYDDGPRSFKRILPG